MQITLTLDLTPENLEKLKIFCDGATAPVPAEIAPKTKPTTKGKTEDAPVKEEIPASAKEAPAKEEKLKKSVSLTDVRAVALEISKAGKSDALKEIFAKFGATKLSEVPKNKYSDLMEELAAVNA